MADENTTQPVDPAKLLAYAQELRKLGPEIEKLSELRAAKIAAIDAFNDQDELVDDLRHRLDDGAEQFGGRLAAEQLILQLLLDCEAYPLRVIQGPGTHVNWPEED